MKVISLFAGIGGFDLGFSRAGHDVVAHVEIDANCRKLLQSKWPDAVCLDDVRTAGKHNLPDCDVVTFGFPCQDLSVAGKRAGLAGGRSGLYYEATRIIDELKPAYCLFENVPGLLSSDGGRDFARVLMEMDRIGYSGAWRRLDAQWFGVAQRRRRVFGVFSRLDSGAVRCAEILSIRESLQGHPAPRRETGQGVAGCIESRTSGGGFPGTDGACAGHVIPAVARTVSCNGARGGIPSSDGLDGALIPAVAGCLQERDAKGADSDTNPGHLVPVAIRTAQTSSNGCGIDESGTSYTLDGAQGQAVAFGGDVARTLAARHDSSPCADRGMDVVAVPAVAYQCQECNEVFADRHATGIGGLAPAECPKCGEEKNVGSVKPVAVSFQPRYFTRDNKTGGAESCGPVTAALSAQHAGGDSAPCVAGTLEIRGREGGRQLEVRYDGTSNALRTPNGGRDGLGMGGVHYGMQVRRLTPTECERLQGFPDGHTAGFSDSTRYKMLGNAVAVPCAEWIARRLRDTL